MKDDVHYDPITGLFTCLYGFRKGQVIGHLDDKGYLRASVRGRVYKLHQLAFILMGLPVPVEIDHDNRIKSDNRWLNLRAVTSAQNQQNRNSKNVYQDKHGFRVIVTRNGARRDLGRFESEELAELVAEEYKDKYKRVYGLQGN